MLDADDRLRLDYDQRNQLLRTLPDVRFKLHVLLEVERIDRRPDKAGAPWGSARPSG